MIENLDIFHPIGTVFETESTSFDPNEDWGGTWELDNTSTVFVSQKLSSPYFSGDMRSTAGSDTVTLNSNQIPAHTHTATIRALISTGSTTYDCSRGSVFYKVNNGSRVWEYYGAGKWYTNSVGGGGGHENRMKFNTVRRWIRTA